MGDSIFLSHFRISRTSERPNAPAFQPVENNKILSMIMAAMPTTNNVTIFYKPFARNLVRRNNPDSKSG